MQSELVWKVGGKTGEGIDSAGEVLALAAKFDGRFVNTFREFPSVIVGGYTAAEVRLSDHPICGLGDRVEVAVVFDEQAAARIAPELAGDALVLYDKAIRLPGGLGEPGSRPRWVPAPLSELAQQQGQRILRNAVALGASAWVMDIAFEAVEQALEVRFSAKGTRTVQMNVAAARAGWEWVSGEGLGRARWVPRACRSDAYALVSGTDTLGFGAVAAGCRLYAGYPITPATELLEWLALELPRFGGVVVQTEDEIAALLIATGASYAGARAMTGTSGPGFSLMTEALGLPAMTETPVVIVDAQRPGPSSGMPTRHEQGDIKHAVFAAHGDLPRIVLSPSSVAECFELMGQAFRLAEKYQCPVIVLVDQDLVLRKQMVPKRLLEPRSALWERLSMLDGRQLEGLRPGEYLRYRQAPSGISPRTLPGQPHGIYLASGDEHDEAGRIDVELPAVRTAAVEKRMGKVEGVRAELAAVRLLFPDGTEELVWDDLDGTAGSPLPADARERLQGCQLGLVAIGSAAMAAREVVRALSHHRPACLAELRYLWPFPGQAVSAVLQEVPRWVVVEHNYSGQLLMLVKAFVREHDRLVGLRKYDGFPFRPAQLRQRLEEVLAGWP